MGKIFRKRYEFWVNLNSPNEFELAEIIDELKERRGFASAIRDGLRIIWELRQRRTDTLLKLFPFLIEQGLRPDPTPEDLLRQFFPGMIVTIAPAGTTPQIPSYPQLPMLSSVQEKSSVKVEAVLDESVARQRTIQHTLAALEDF